MTSSKHDGSEAGPKPSEMPDDVFNACLKAAMDSQNSKLDLSTDERNNLLSAMEKPEFTQLMKSYMDEISDPKHRAEQEDYLRQLEKDNKVPQNMQLVHPKAGFALKLKKSDQQAGGAWVASGKLFINICGANEVAKAAPGEKTAKGAQWSLPYSLGPMRHENDKAGEAQPTFDFCLHEDTLAMAIQNANFQKMVIDTAVDAVERRVKEVLKGSIKLDISSARVLKGVSAVGGKPAIMQFPKKLDTSEKDGKAQLAVPAQTSSQASKPATTLKEQIKKANPVERVKPANEPKFTVVHRGQIDLADFVESSNEIERVSKRPKELVIRVQVPKIKSAKYLDIETSETCFKLSSTDKKVADYELDLALPYPVDEEKGSAKFDKAARTLEVTLPVRPPVLEGKTLTRASPPTINATKEPHKLVEEIKPTTPIEAATSLSPDLKNNYADKAKHERWVGEEKEKDEEIPEKKEEEEQQEEEGKPAGKEEDADDAEEEINTQKAKEIDASGNLAELLRQAKEAAKLPLPKAEDHQPKEPTEAPEPPVKTSEEQNPETDAVAESADFLPSATFSGSKPGYVFKKGDSGMGYYVDNIKATATRISNVKVDEDERPAPSEELASKAMPKKVNRLELRSKEIFELD